MTDAARLQNEEYILEVATRVFSEHGYADVSMRDIASELQMTAGTIYRYFPDKQALYDSCCAHVHAMYKKSSEEAIASAGDAKGKISAFSLWLLDFLINDTVSSRLVQRQLLENDIVGFDKLTGNQFAATFQNLVEWISELTGKRTAVSRAYSLLAYSNGLTHLRATSRASGKRIAKIRYAARLSQEVLSAVLPEIYGETVW